jgi:hypothetical protein
MNFLWPTAWWLALLGVPIVLFYLIRQRLRAKPVTTLLFWENLSPKVHNLPLWRKLRHLISLLLQLLLFALLLFAVARPVLPGQLIAKSSTILVLDPGVTMTATLGKQIRWQTALDLARDKIAAMDFGDEATLILAGNPPQVLSPWTRRKAELRAALQTAQVAPTVTDIRDTLRLAQNLRLSHPGAAIELISDTVWPVPPTADDWKNVKLDRVGSNATNSGITLFSARELSSGAGEYQLALRLEQNTSAPISGELQVTRNGALMDVLNVTIPAGQPWLKFWRGQGTDAMSFEAHWKPQSTDDFAADQQATAKLEAVRTLNVALVSPEFPFLEIAFATQPLVKEQRVWPAPATAPTAGLLVYHEAAPAGNTLPHDAVLIDPPTSGPWGERVGPIDQPLISDLDRDSPLMRFTDLMPVQLQHATEFRPPPGAHVYVSSFGKPLIYGHWESEPRWLVLAFNLDQSDFVFRTAFPIFCANLIEAVRGDSGGAATNLPGPVATQLKPLAPASAPALVATEPGTSFDALRWLRAIPLWWWVAFDAFLLLLIEWSLYTRRITE